MLSQDLALLAILVRRDDPVVVLLDELGLQVNCLLHFFDLDISRLDRRLQLLLLFLILPPFFLRIIRWLLLWLKCTWSVSELGLELFNLLHLLLIFVLHILQL